MFDLYHLKLFGSFCLVGFAGMGIDFLVTWLIKEKLKGNKYLANCMGFTTAASFNYLFNRIWTFHSQSPEIAREYASFIVISVIGLLINNTILWFLHDKHNLQFYYAKLIAIGITVLWNFFANYFITFAL